MIIESIYKKNDNTVGIQFDDGQYLFLSYEIFLKNSLRKGKELSQDDYDKIILENRRYFINKKALDYIGRRTHSANELKLKLLKKGYEKILVDEVINSLIKKQIINDKHFAELFVEENVRRKLWGKKKAEAELFKKGINREIIKEVLTELMPPENNYDNALKAAQKKITTSTINDKKTKDKILRFLMGKGYDYETSSSVIRNLLKDDDEEYDY